MNDFDETPVGAVSAFLGLRLIFRLRKSERDRKKDLKNMHFDLASFYVQ